MIRVDRGSPAYRAGLRSGDVLACLSPRDHALLFSMLGVAAYPQESVIHLCVQRDGTWRSLSFRAIPRPPTGYIYAKPLLAVVRLLVYVVFILCGLTLVLVRPSALTWALYAYCLCSGPVYNSYVDATLYPPLPCFLLLVASLLIANAGEAWLLLFAVAVPEQRTPCGWRRHAFRAAAAFGVLWTLFPFALTASTNVYVSLATLGNIVNVLAVLTIFVVLVRLVEARAEERARLGWAAFAILWGVVTNDLRVVFSAPGFSLIVAQVAADLTVVMPIALTYAILRRHVMDVRFVLGKGAVYTLITTIVVAVIGIVDWATNAYLHEARAALALDALVTIALGFVLHRTYRVVERFVDAVIFREKHTGEAYLHRLARTLPFAESEETVHRAIVCAPCEKLALAGASLFRECDRGFAPICAEGWQTSELPALRHDHALPRFFMSERGSIYVADLHEEMRAALPEGSVPAFAVPIFQRNDLTGFALYGLHRDGTRLDPDEERVLERLCEAAAQAYSGVELDEYRNGVRVSPLSVGISPS